MNWKPVLIVSTVIIFSVVFLWCDLSGNKYGDDTTPPGDVSDLEATEGDGKITLSWENPSDDDIEAITITYTAEKGIASEESPQEDRGPSSAIKKVKKDISEKRPSSIIQDQESNDFERDLSTELKQKTAVVGAKGSTTSVDAESTIAIIEDLENGTEYTFIVKVVDTAGNESDGKSISAIPKAIADTAPPGEVNNLSAEADDGEVTLTWENPTDADFDHCEVWYGTDGSADIEFSGTVDCTGTTITELTNGTEYTFTVKTVDAEGNVSSGESTTATPVSEYADMNEFTVGSSGGEYEDPSGVLLTIPEGAVDGETKVYTKQIEVEELNFIIDAGITSAEDLLFALRGEVIWNDSSSQEAFNKPITATIPLPSLQPGYSVLVKECELEEEQIKSSQHTYLVDPINKSVELELDNFCTLTLEQREENRRGEEYCNDPDTACRCLKHRSVYEHTPYLCQIGENTCKYIIERLEQTYYECPDSPTEITIEKKITPTCKPSLLLQADKTVIEVGDSVDVEALFKLGCAPFKNQNINFEITGPGSLNVTDEVTNASGKVVTTVTGNDVGTIDISAEGTGQYYERELIINDEVEVQENKHTVTVTAGITIHVIEPPTLTLSADPPAIGHGETASLTAVLMQGDQPLEGQTVNFSVSGPATLSTTSGATNSNGEAGVVLTAGDTDGTVTIDAES